MRLNYPRCMRTTTARHRCRPAVARCALVVLLICASTQLESQSRFNIPSQRISPNKSDELRFTHTLPPLTATAWVVDFDPRPTKDINLLFRELYELARIRLSAMLYGYEYSYIPAHKERDVQEQFEFKLIRELSPNDRGIQLISSWERGEQLHGQFAYRIPAREVRWLNAWFNSPTITGGGKGRVGAWSAEDAQHEVVVRALADAVRRYILARYPNTPRRVNGFLLMRDGPRVWISGGEYYAELFTRIRVSDVIEYELD